ncbi:stromal cell-derived factor 2-like protein 1 [Orycteropus afer afer]|uniref:Stromal cell-derived factor 2-like protein 1 n=1 Tax=Orycteropus afer afer TaxID=1230840 RepID=A0A8B7B180_ORYAF|nr:stromal cell-derived factor 2-like protein 1 [Orycteropus afer afer]
MWSAGRGWVAGPALLGLLLVLAVRGGGGTQTRAGFVTCGSVLKLLNTHHRVRLHSHDIKYGSGARGRGRGWGLPGRGLRRRGGRGGATARAEVSAFGEDGEGDDLDLWTVRCSGQQWERQASVRFQHVGTSVFLSVTGEQYGSPIRGQYEVHGMSSASSHNTWKAMEGVFIKPSAEPSAAHDEL